MRLIKNQVKVLNAFLMVDEIFNAKLKWYNLTDGEYQLLRSKINLKKSDIAKQKSDIEKFKQQIEDQEKERDKKNFFLNIFNTKGQVKC